MKTLYFIPLLFLTACSTAPKISVRPQQPPLMPDNIRYPEIVRAYHFGRYVDPNDDLVMHEQHVVFRVEENARWDLHPASGGNAFFPFTPPSRDVAFSPTPVSDAVLAEVNSQRLATTQIMAESKVLTLALQQLQTSLQDARKNEQATASLRTALAGINERLHALEISAGQPSGTATNTPAEALSP